MTVSQHKSLTREDKGFGQQMNSSIIHDSIRSLIHKKYHHPKSYHSDVKYHMTLNIIFRVSFYGLFKESSLLLDPYPNSSSFMIPRFHRMLSLVAANQMALEVGFASIRCISEVLCKSDFPPMIGENRQLVTNEPLEFEK